MSRDEYFSFRGSFVPLNLQHVPCNIPDSHSSLHLPDFGRVKKTNYPTAPFRKLQERGLGGRSFARAPRTRPILDIDKAEYLRGNTNICRRGAPQFQHEIY